MTRAPERVVDYDRFAAGYDRRYDILEYAGVRDALLNFVGDAHAILEVGCGTGHWLAMLDARLTPSRCEHGGSPHGDNASATASAERLIVGVEPSSEMIARARAAVPAARVVRGRAEALPWRDATFDRVCCINALHHFADREQFFAEARRILRPGGGLLTIGKDPHTERDAWWVYDFFPETLEIDRQRFARVRTLRGEMTLAGFSWSESFEVDRIERLQSATDALATGIVHRSFTSQLSVLTEGEFDAGVARIRAANDAASGELQLMADFCLFATVGWV
ncbi:MAG TPA: methyltransferase domain-containing protein [Vicinamibacterales bacterium]|nr:methyltransferase domain-containing protein [Vicinamibacterales bacterium]